MQTTYGQNFEKTEKSVETVYYQDVSEVSGDDLIIQLQLSWDVWEYPVKNSYNNGTSTTILVMFPRMSVSDTSLPMTRVKFDAFVKQFSDTCHK